ncbi:MAG: ATP synthase F0 subunit B [Culicoidibacterales bacterium]
MHISIDILPSLQIMIGHTVSLTILLLIFYFFLWKNFAEYLNRRKQQITSEFDKAKIEQQQATKNVARTKEEYESARKQARKILQTAQFDAKRQHELIVERARQEATDEISRGKNVSNQLYNQAMERFNQDAVELAMSATKNLLIEHATSNASDLIDQSLQKVGELND